MLASIKALYNRSSEGWQALKALAEKDFKTLWNEYRYVFIALSIVIVGLKWRTWLINFIVSDSKQMYQNAQNKNQSLEIKEDSTQVTEDWYKDTKNE
jgi:hypothetical protein